MVQEEIDIQGARPLGKGAGLGEVGEDDDPPFAAEGAHRGEEGERGPGVEEGGGKGVDRGGEGPAVPPVVGVETERGSRKRRISPLASGAAAGGGAPGPPPPLPPRAAPD